MNAVRCSLDKIGYIIDIKDTEYIPNNANQTILLQSVQLYDHISILLQCARGFNKTFEDGVRIWTRCNGR